MFIPYSSVGSSELSIVAGSLKICVEGVRTVEGRKSPPPCDGVELISCLLAEWPELE